MAPGSVRSPGTTSTNGIRCGGLNGWAIKRRLGFFILRDCSVAVFAELDDRSNACEGTCCSMRAPQVLLEFHAFRSVLLDKIDAGHSAIEVGLEEVSSSD